MRGRGRLRIGVVGCGAFAERFYLPALARARDRVGRIVLVEPDPERRARLGAHADVALADAREAEDAVDGAVVAAPHHLHHPVAAFFLERGIPVLCEKPLAVSAKEARDLVETARAHGALLCVNQTRRFYPAFAEIARRLAAGELGRIRSFEHREGATFSWPTASGFYFGAESGGRGVLLDKGAHVLDLLCWWLDERPHLVSCLVDGRYGPEGVAELRISHRGAGGLVHLNWLVAQPNRFRIVGERGAIEGAIDDLRGFVLVRDGRRRRIAVPSSARSYWDLGRAVVDDFLSAIGEGAEPRVPGEAVIPSLELIDECYDRARGFDMPWYDEEVDGRS